MRTRTRLLITVVFALALPSLTTAAVILHPQGDNSTKLQIYGFSQLEMRGGDAFSDGGGVFFQAQRIRLGTKYFHGPWFSKLFLDFNQSYTDKEAGLPKVIKDMFIGYRFDDAAFVRMGMIKTPVGMGFTIPGWDLDIVERNMMDKGLQLERDFGIMISGRQIGGKDDPKKINGTEMGHEKQSGFGFGYDLGFFNAAGRSAAVIWEDDLAGTANAYAGRLHYDHGWPFHIEVAYGLSQKAGGGGTEDYKVFDVGIDSNPLNRKASLKLEFVKGENIKGEAGWDQTCAVGTVGYLVHPQAELVIKHYEGKSEKAAVETTLRNTYIGVNFFIAKLGSKPQSLQAHRIQINYIIVSGADNEATVPFTGLAGAKDNGWVMQWQYKF